MNRSATTKAIGKGWTVADIPSQAGRRALIAGANSGIGYHAALELARKGAHVLLGCRNQSKGDAALARMRAEAPGARRWKNRKYTYTTLTKAQRKTAEADGKTINARVEEALAKRCTTNSKGYKPAAR